MYSCQFFLLLFVILTISIYMVLRFFSGFIILFFTAVEFDDSNDICCAFFLSCELYFAIVYFPRWSIAIDLDRYIM